MEDRTLVIKLSSGEELIADLAEQTDTYVKIYFPMLVKTIPRMEGNRIMESLTLAPWSYFSASDEFIIDKSHIICTNDLDPVYLDQYRSTVEDYIDRDTERKTGQDVTNVNELAEKIKQLIGSFETTDETDIEPVIIEGNKTIH